MFNRNIFSGNANWTGRFLKNPLVCCDGIVKANSCICFAPDIFDVVWI